MRSLIRSIVAAAAAGAALLVPAGGQAGSAPALAWSPTTSPGTYDYGTVTGSASRTFTLTNSGGVASGMVTVTLSAVSGPAGAFTKTADACSGTSLGPKKSCGVSVRYSGSGGSDSARLAATAKKPPAAVSIALKGNNDATPPDTTITDQPSNPSNVTSPSFSFSGSDSGGSGVAGFECRLDTGAYAACTSPKTYSALADGSHTFTVYAVDRAGNRDPTPASYTWTVDATPPDTTITSQPSNPSNSSSPSFEFTGSDGGSGVASFQCNLDGSTAACTSGQTYSVLDGRHNFQVYAVDAAGNADPSPAGRSWTVDATPPDTTIDSHPPDPSSSSSASFTFSGSDSGTGVDTFRCQLDGGFSVCHSSTNCLANGSHTFTVSAVDRAGNVDPTPASFTWTVAARHIYWTSGGDGTIQKANLDGSCPQTIVTGQNGPTGVAVASSHLYWANDGDGTIRGANLDGSSPQTIVFGQVRPQGVAVDSSHLYWANIDDGTINRANLDGSSLQPIVSGQRLPIGVAVDSSHLYWTNEAVGTVNEANLDGSSPQQIITGEHDPIGVAVDSSHLYWDVYPGTINEANLDGSGRQTIFSGRDGAYGVAVDSSHLYWANVSGTINRANLDGSNPQIIVSGQGNPAFVAVDAG